MAFLVVANERYALPIGETVLGGDGPEGAIPIPLASPHATLTVDLDGAASIRRHGSEPVSVNGVRLGALPVSLRHADRIQVGGIPMVFGDIGGC